MPQVKLFYGNEDFLIDEELKKMRSSVNGDLNLERINGAKASIDQMVSAINTLPMLGGERLVIIEGLHQDEKEEGELFSVLRSLAQGTQVVFVNYGSLDKRRKFYKLIEEIGETREFKRLSEWEQDKALAWAYGRAKHYGKKLSGQAASLLIEIVGLNLRMLDKELEKISTFIGDKEMIEDGDVSLLASSGELDSFALSTAVQERKVSSAISSLERLFSDNADPHMMIGMLAKGFRMLLQVKSLERANMSQYEIAGQLKAKPFFVKKCMERTRNFSGGALARNIRLLHEADLRMKSGYSPRLTLEMLIPELCDAG